MNKSSLTQLITVPKIEDDALLMFMEGQKEIPFSIKRVYIITNCDSKLDRGHHSHKVTEQVLFCIKGCVDMYLDNSSSTELVTIDRPNIGIYLPPNLWHEMRNISKDAIMLVVASHKYDEQDYIRDYEEFISYSRKSS